NHIRKNGKGSQITIPDAATVFHVYALEWDKARLDFFVDGHKYFTYENEAAAPTPGRTIRSNISFLTSPSAAIGAGPKALTTPFSPSAIASITSVFTKSSRSFELQDTPTRKPNLETSQ